jgi:HD-like signal output (HDOD) protein
MSQDTQFASPAGKPTLASPTSDLVDVVTRLRIEEDLTRLGELHSAPSVVQEVLAQTRRLDFDVKKLADTITRDPALAAKIIRLINSAAYSLRRPVKSLPQAILLIGQRTLRLVVMTFSLVDKLSKGVGGQIYDNFWKRSLTSALAAHKLAGTRTDVDPDEAYASGLFIDIGVLVLAQLQPEEYAKILLTVPHDHRLAQAERDAFGYDHTQVGFVLLERWGFPPVCQRAARYHHTAFDESAGLELTATASSLVAEMLWLPDSQTLATARTLLQREFHLDTDKLIELVLYCKEEVAQQASLFGVQINDQINIAAVLEEARRLFVAASIETAMDFDSAMNVVAPPS